MGAGGPKADRVAGVPQGITVVVAAFLPILAIVSMFPAVPAIIDHFSDDPGATWKVPSMVSAPGLTIALTAFLAGILVDRFGRRKLLLVSTFFFGVFGTAPFFLDSLDAVYATRLMLGFTEAALLTVVNTLIADYWEESGRRNWLTVQNMAGPALSSLVLFFAGSLVEWRWNAIFLIYLVAFPILIAMWKWLYEPEQNSALRARFGHDGTPIAATGFPWGIVFGIGLLTLISSLLYYVFIVNGGLVWKELGVSDPGAIGRITSLPSLFILAGALLFWFVNKKGLGSRFQFLIFLGLLGVGLALMGIAQDWKGMVLGMVVQQTGAGMAIPTLIAWSQRRLPAQHRGKGMGVWAACFFFGQFSSPLIVSQIRMVLGTMQETFLAAGLVGVSAGILTFIIFSITSRTTSEPAAA